ncbi:MAG: alpha/beta fold hydrolase [Thermodesulfobacteriota bacterium]
MTPIENLSTILHAHVNGIRLAYRAFGSGRPLLCLMGFSASMDMWPRVMLERLSRIRRVILMDNRGIGHSSGGEEPYRFDDMALDSLALLDHLGFRETDILGFSMGSDITLAMLRINPEPFRKVVLYAGGPGGDDEIIPDERLRMVFRAVEGKTKARAAAMFRLMFPDEWLEEHGSPRECIPRLNKPVRQEAVKAQLQAVRSRPSEAPALQRIRIPVQLITGSEDLLTPPENSRFMARLIPRSTLIEIQGAGHGLMYQYPDTFLKHVEDFLRAGALP